MMRRYMWKEVNTSDYRCKDEDSVLFSVYTPAITVSLASKLVRRINLSCSLSLSSLPLLPFQCRILSFCKHTTRDHRSHSFPPPDQSPLNQLQAHPLVYGLAPIPTAHATPDSTIPQHSRPPRGCITAFRHILHRVKRRLIPSP